MQSLTFFVGKLGADGIAVVLDELSKKGEQKERVFVFTEDLLVLCEFVSVLVV